MKSIRLSILLALLIGLFAVGATAQDEQKQKPDSNSSSAKSKSTTDSDSKKKKNKEDKSDKKSGKDAAANSKDSNKSDREYLVGAKGGCYYLTESGKKVYVSDKSLCGSGN
jgi:cytoskeletal protein RodZ